MGYKCDVTQKPICLSNSSKWEKQEGMQCKFCLNLFKSTDRTIIMTIITGFEQFPSIFKVGFQAPHYGDKNNMNQLKQDSFNSLFNIIFYWF